MIERLPHEAGPWNALSGIATCLVAVGLLCVARAPEANAAACAPYGAGISLDFQTLDPGPTYDNTLTTTDIRHLLASGHYVVSDARGRLLGVTLASPVFSIEARTRLEPQAGGICVYLEKVIVAFGLRDFAVHVAAEFQPGTCEYKTILDHENQHVAINRAVLQEVAPQVRLSLERLLGGERPILSADPRHATRELLDALTQNMQPVLDGLKSELERRNAGIDTEENYEATAALCHDWERGIVWPQIPASGSVQDRGAPVRAYPPVEANGSR